MVSDLIIIYSYENESCPACLHSYVNVNHFLKLFV